MSESTKEIRAWEHASAQACIQLTGEAAQWMRLAWEVISVHGPGEASESHLQRAAERLQAVIDAITEEDEEDEGGDSGTAGSGGDGATGGD